MFNSFVINIYTLPSLPDSTNTSEVNMVRATVDL